MLTLLLDVGGHLADLKDKLTQRTVERLVHGFGVQSPTAGRSYTQRQISHLTRLGSLVMVYSLSKHTISDCGAYLSQHDPSYRRGEKY